MGKFTKVEKDIAAMAEYWGYRKATWRARAAEEFESSVCPAAFYLGAPTLKDIQLVNVCFSEWVLFERQLRDGKTPLQLYIEQPPVGVSSKTVNRLQQVAATQFFSRFAIEKKDRTRGIALLRDVRTGEMYDVLDEHLCNTGRWRAGTIALRIARVNDQWQTVGQARLYDTATPETTAIDGPGEIHPEDEFVIPPTKDMSFYLRLLRDIIGIDGRYNPTLRYRDYDDAA